MADRLVSWPVLAEEYRVVGPHPGTGHAHQRSETDRAAHVVGELEERGAEST